MFETAVNLSKYIDDKGERPVLRGHNILVSTVAYRAMSGSWCLCELGYEFSLSDSEILAALLYYEQFRERIDALEGNLEPEMDAMD